VPNSSQFHNPFGCSNKAEDVAPNAKDPPTHHHDEFASAEMRLEIKSAATFLMSLLRMGNTLNDQQLEFFRNKLEELLKKHYQHHWFPEKPNKGSGYRCLRINHKMDPLIAQAAMSSGVVSESSLLHGMFPNELTLWIDPREVSYRIGENGSICVLYDGSITTAPSSNTSSSNSMERYSTCKESLRGFDNMIMDPRNMNFEQYATYVSS